MTASDAAPAPWEIWHARFNFDNRGYKFCPILVLAYSPGGLLAAMITSASNKLSLHSTLPSTTGKRLDSRNHLSYE